MGCSPVLKPVDEQPVWSLPCFFADRASRNEGVARALLCAAIDHAAAQGARVVEGYPVEPSQQRMPDLFAFTGTPALFGGAGFNEVARRFPTRPIMRRTLAIAG